MAVVANQRPDLFAFIKPKVAVTDMIRASKFTSAGGGIVDFGNTFAEEGAVEYLMKYSPYHNV